MLINISNQYGNYFFSYSTKVNRYSTTELKIDLNKHYPVFKLFDVNNIYSEEQLAKYKNNNFNCIIGPSYFPKDYTKDHLNLFLSKKRDIGLSYVHNFKRTKYLLENIDNIKYPLLSSDNYLYSFYTLGSCRTGFIYIMCVKQEYIYYVKLCVLAGVKPEFDCFYLLAVNDPQNKCLSLPSKRINSFIKKAIKDYSIPVIYVNSIEEEISKPFVLPKFNTIKDYNNWLDNIKNRFLESVRVKQEDKIEEDLPF